MSMFARELIKLKYYALDKKSCLNEMVELLYEKGIVKFPERFFKSIIDREKLMSTGIGRKVAIPHARSDAVDELKIAVYLLDNELEFDSIDGEPVQIIFMIAVPERMKEVYMKVLSAISNFFRKEENRDRILHCTSVDELCTILEEVNDEI
ncbi:MAG: PTS sugar transporter subunit IIA [Candidatus Cloacimonadales bacterium]|nr:PTS sugar transporter subunit IIA [Candidatus Cloacimonadales bacterium]